MRRRMALVGVGCLTIALAVAAGVGGGGGSSATAAPAAKQLTGSITLAGWNSGGSTEGQLLKQMLAGFKKKYPKINVTYTPLDPYQQNILAQFAARKPPDVLYVDSNDFPDWVKQGLLEPLDSYIAKYKFSRKPFYPRLLGAFQQKGKTYGFPKGFSPLSMEVNTDIRET